MPEEDYWNSLFDIPTIIKWLNLGNIDAPIVEIGCGYGTFTPAVGKLAKFTVYAFDIDSSMIQAAKMNVQKSGINNVDFHLRDVLDTGTGLESNSVGMVLLFNILHFETRRVLLEEACRILKPEGIAAIIHWRNDIPTPRGPSIESRPDKQIILDSVRDLDLSFDGNSKSLEPYHWGMQLIKAIKQTKETE